jgi:hypothetical protein
MMIPVEIRFSFQTPEPLSVSQIVKFSVMIRGWFSWQLPFSRDHLHSFYPRSRLIPFDKLFQFPFFPLSILNNSHSSGPATTRMISVFSIGHQQSCIISLFWTWGSLIWSLLKKIENGQTMHLIHFAEWHHFKECYMNFVARPWENPSAVIHPLQWTLDSSIASPNSLKQIRFFREFWIWTCDISSNIPAFLLLMVPSGILSSPVFHRSR